MNFPKRHRPLVIAFLSITIVTRLSASTEPMANQHAPPFWQFVLREFIFKTISPPGHQDDDLFDKIRDAPFYGGALPVVSYNDNVVVSSGKVYNMPSGQWILCQEGCKKCEPCDQQRHEPAVKWTLRRVKRTTSLGLPKWDLRLTVVPQMDESFRINKHRPRYNDVYVVNQNDSEAESGLVPTNTQHESAFEKAQDESSWGSNGAERADDDYRRGSTRFERYRLKRRPSSTYYRSHQDPIVKSPADDFQEDTEPRLIVGIDQYGKKHLVHLIPVDSPLKDPGQTDTRTTSYRPSNKWANAARISRTIQQEGTYEKLMERILDSFNTHRNFVEKFLFPDSLESVDHNEADIPLYSTYRGNDNERFEERNLDGYRIDDSREINQYSSSLEYQVEEQAGQLRRYPDMRRMVNKPYGEYQDQNAMIEHEPYGVSAEGQQQQKLQDERSLPLADVERKRRNSFAKLMDSAVRHQNHTQTDESEIEFSIKRDFMENSTNQALANLPLKINQTDLSIWKLPEALEMQTLNSDD